MAFQVLEVAHELARSLRAPIEKLALRDSALADQLRRAVTSIALNIAESTGREGNDRKRFLRIAQGSATEARSALRIAVTWGHLGVVDVSSALGYLDRVCAMLWRTLHKRPADSASASASDSASSSLLRRQR